MKNFFVMCFGMILLLNNIVYANNAEITHTQNTDIKCRIDGLNIDSYLIDGFIYLPLDKLEYYGFEVVKNSGGLQLERKEIFYFDGDYSDNKNEILPVYKNDTSVFINNKEANTYLVDDKIVIQADELSAFGKVEWVEKTNEVSISIVVQELISAFEKAENKIEYSDKNSFITGQVKDCVLNGMVTTSYFQGITYIGHMVDGEYEGVVFGYREHKPYLAALSEIKTVKKGKKNGYCRYNVGYNNKPQMPGEIKSSSGMYEDDKLKNGEYTIVSDYMGNTETYIAENFAKHILSSTHDGLEFETSDARIFYNGEKIDFDVPPIVENDRTLIPLRGLFEKMGAEVSWDGNTSTAAVVKNDTRLSFQKNYYRVYVNGVAKYMDVPTRLTGGRTMIPLRFLSDELGYEVNWNENTRTIDING